MENKKREHEEGLSDGHKSMHMSSIAAVSLFAFENHLKWKSYSNIPSLSIEKFFFYI